jgi:hypothetical protein
MRTCVRAYEYSAYRVQPRTHVSCDYRSNHIINQEKGLKCTSQRLGAIEVALGFCVQEQRFSLTEQMLFAQSVPLTKACPQRIAAPPLTAAPKSRYACTKMKSERKRT